MKETFREKPTSGMCFPVDAVSPAVEPILTETLAESVAERLQRKILFLPGGAEHVIDPFSHSVHRARGIRRTPQRLRHPLIDAIHIGFSQHRPLTLSPDAIWMVIAQGFGHHVAENAEELRRRLVGHEGKRELSVHIESLTLSGFEDAVTSLSEQIRRHTDQVLHETLVCDFSTTTAGIRTASEVVLMDTFSSYFTYAMMCVCGIPKITIEGTPEDWQRIRARIEILATYGLEWWVSRLGPILDEFVLAAEGRPNREFWKAIYKPKSAYNAQFATGWIAELFPYLGDPPGRRRNPVFTSGQFDWRAPVDYSNTGLHFPPFDSKHDSGVTTSQFPSGLSRARVTLRFPDDARTEVDLLGGFMAVKQDAEDLSLSPAIGWCVAERPPEKPVVVF
jgi:Domain of unknown function (DUF4419)